MPRIAIGTHDIRTESHGHHIGLDTPVLCVAYGRERGQDTALVDGTHRQDIVRVTRRGDFLPRSHARIAGAAYQDHALVGNV